MQGQGRLLQRQVGAAALAAGLLLSWADQVVAPGRRPPQNLFVLPLALLPLLPNVPTSRRRIAGR